MIPRGEPGLHAVLPSVALVGSPVSLRVSALDDLGAPLPTWSASLTLESTDANMIAPPFGPGDGHVIARGLIFRTPGIHRVTVRNDDGKETVAGPVRVVRTTEELRPRAGEAARRIYWGDAHGHTDVGDGANPPPQYLYYARDVAHLDFVCLSEHDFQQFLAVGLDTDPSSWDRLASLAGQWRRPGFAVLLGWEWSSRQHGHRVVLFPDDASRYVSFRDAATPAELAEALRGTGAVSVIAHPTGSRLTPVVNWDTVVPGFDRAIEIYSGHGTMDEDPDFRPTSDPSDAHSALESIRRGLGLSLVAFSDTHLSTPGNPWPPEIRDAPYRGGLTGVWATGSSEAEILDAIRQGHCYATSGERFVVDLRLDGHMPGEVLTVPPGTRVRVQALAASSNIVTYVELMAGTEVVKKFAGGGPQIEIDFGIESPTTEAAYWLRGFSEAGERFWTSAVRVGPL